MLQTQNTEQLNSKMGHSNNLIQQTTSEWECMNEKTNYSCRELWPREVIRMSSILKAVQNVLLRAGSASECLESFDGCLQNFATSYSGRPATARSSEPFTWNYGQSQKSHIYGAADFVFLPRNIVLLLVDPASRSVIFPLPVTGWQRSEIVQQCCRFGSSLSDLGVSQPGKH